MDGSDDCQQVWLDRDDSLAQAGLVRHDCLWQARYDFLQQARVRKMEGHTLIQFRDLSYRELFELTTEEEDQKYGCLKTFSQKTLETWMIFNPEELEKYIRNHDLVWDGMDAAFIKCPSRVKLAQIPENWDATFIKWHGHVKDTNVLDEGEASIQEPVITLLKRRKDYEFIPLQYRKEFAVAVLAHMAIVCFVDWSDFEYYFGRQKRKEVEDRLFIAAVKLVLDIFDVEDFKRICYRKEISDEYTRLCEEFAKKGYRVTSRLQEFPHLLESDIYDALEKLPLPLDSDIYDTLCLMRILSPEKYNFVIRSLKNCHYSKAQKLMEKHIPLKGHFQAQLLMELARIKCFHVTDTLLLQAIHSVDLPGFFGDCGIDEEKSRLFQYLSNCMLEGFDLLIDRKVEMLVIGHVGLTYIAYNKFGTCKDEVAEVIKLADLERKLVKAPYTKPMHYATAFSVSRVREDYTKMIGISEQNPFGDWPERMYTYELCHLSFRLAKEIHKVDGEWGLEYLVFAFFFGPSMENVKKCFYKYSDIFERLRSCESPYSVKGWKNIDVFTVLLEDRSRYGESIKCKGYKVVNKLHEEVETGKLQLPKYEELRSIS